MAKRFTDTEKWKDEWFMDLDRESKLFWLYLLDNCDHAGIWKVNWKLAEFMIDMVDRVGVENSMVDRVVDLGNGYWHIPKFIEFQYGNLNPDNKVHKSVLAILDRFSLAPSKPLGSPLVGSKDKDKDKVKDKTNSQDGFDTFWETTSKNGSRKKASERWAKMTKEERVKATTQYPLHLNTWEKEQREKKYHPHVVTWLNQERWEDEIEETKSFGVDPMGNPLGDPSKRKKPRAVDPMGNIL